MATPGRPEEEIGMLKGKLETILATGKTNKIYQADERLQRLYRKAVFATYYNLRKLGAKENAEAIIEEFNKPDQNSDQKDATTARALSVEEPKNIYTTITREQVVRFWAAFDNYAGKISDYEDAEKAKDFFENWREGGLEYFEHPSSSSEPDILHPIRHEVLSGLTWERVQEVKKEIEDEDCCENNPELTDNYSELQFEAEQVILSYKNSYFELMDTSNIRQDSEGCTGKEVSNRLEQLLIDAFAIILPKLRSASSKVNDSLVEELKKITLHDMLREAEKRMYDIQQKAKKAPSGSSQSDELLAEVSKYSNYAKLLSDVVNNII